MAMNISASNLAKLMPLAPNALKPTQVGNPSSLIQSDMQSFDAKNDPTALILQSAMQKINEMFAPHLGDGALQKALDSAQDMSPKATAERILSFATQLIGRAESDQADLPVEEQRSRERLFNNIQIGVEKGFEQARGILEGMDGLHGKTKETVNSTYDYVQQGLRDLAILLDLQSPKPKL